MTVILDFSAKNKFEVMTVFEKNQLHNAGHLKTLWGHFSSKFINLPI